MFASRDLIPNHYEGFFPSQFQLAFKRLDRELKPTDEHGKALREALAVFQQTYEAGGSLGKQNEDVYEAVRQVQSHR